MPAYTIEDFVAKAIKTHGDRYDYSAVAYEQSKTPVTIVCSEHGPFQQQPVQHLRGSGCPACGNQRRSRGPRPARRSTKITTAEFIRRAREIHGDAYDYSDAEYKGGYAAVRIRCPRHGVFETVARQHLYKGAGCRRCRRPTPVVPRRLARSMGTDEFIRRAVSVHGDRYDYTSALFETVSRPVEIGCHRHGPFTQTPNNHLYSGAGCPTCGRDSVADGRRSDTDGFISSALLVHGSTYDYSLVDYLDANHHVTIVCRTHGNFDQTARGHLSGGGCRRCVFDARSLTRDDLVERMADVFPEPYSYDDVPAGFTPVRSRITVGCRRHGAFDIQVGDHLRGTACPRCRFSRPEKLIADALDAAGVAFVGQWTHPTLRDQRALRFDFMLPTTKTLIEFDGIFHFKAVQWSGDTHDDAVARLQTVQRHDAMKNRWAAENGWRLIRLTGRAFLDDLRDAGVLPPTNRTHDLRRPPL